MIISKPTNTELIPYSTVKIGGCSETKLGFDFLSEQPSVGKRRYCNKVLVHECVSAPAAAPLDLTKVELLATDDSCYTFFNVYKSSDQIQEIEPTIELQENDDYLIIGVIITFSTEEIIQLPIRMAYRLYGYYAEGDRILLSQGNLFTNPCGTGDPCEKTTWLGLAW
jgi:hypothetical protein